MPGHPQAVKVSPNGDKNYHLTHNFATRVSVSARRWSQWWGQNLHGPFLQPWELCCWWQWKWNSNTGSLSWVAHLDNINRVALLLSFCKRSLAFIDPELGDKQETILI